eukprot:CAMPEP_0179152234 /NCGR_PEP_ID=MMETSP0796-20121207/73967_1 /TAXON_ID=73915 /ORGANISM="Pyrodinium bahamense, Strain pbaha01" /LENGTH=620 /DNA_ID=CAMNT_0020853423 /DNA_START=14 /DNA_END=1876 /DNA_ORIENTATION=+
MWCVKLLPLNLAAIVSVGLITLGHASSLRKVGEATVAAVEASLVSELAGNVSKARLADLEDELLPMYSALPKVAGGHLGHQTVRYALHRVLLQRHGWFIVGLEPNDEALPPYLHGEWVPEYLQGLLEERLGGRGINLQEIAALAAVLEDLVHAEAAARVDQVYGLLQLSPSGRLGGQEAEGLVETYMMLYLDGGNFSVSRERLEEMAQYFKRDYADWAAAESWMREIMGRYVLHAADKGLDRTAVVSIVDELGEKFGAFNDGECRTLKSELVGMESQRPGRVLLADFYRKGLYSHWQFNEKKEYLRSLGALDESDPLRPSIIVPNYLGSRPNCLVASSLYAVCCRNECEDLMAHLEYEAAASTAYPQRIQELITDLPASSIVKPPVLSETLVQRLEEVARRHGGQVPLHGRLFAQWLHHAFPRECPYPHEEGMGPQTPDEWLREAGAGQGTARASEEEVRQILNACGAGGPCAGAEVGGNASEEELPWSDTEKLLAMSPAQPAAHLFGLRAVVVMGAALVILLVAPGLLQASAPGVGSDKGHDWDLDNAADFQKPASRAAQKPWRLALLILAVAIILEAVGLLDRFAFACTLGGGLVVVLVVPLAVRSPQAQRKKTEHCV